MNKVIVNIEKGKDMNFIKEWAGAIDAARELNLNNGCISLCCKGKIKYT